MALHITSSAQHSLEQATITGIREQCILTLCNSRLIVLWLLGHVNSILLRIPKRFQGGIVVLCLSEITENVGETNVVDSGRE
jgi:hypothetical protein